MRTVVDIIGDVVGALRAEWDNGATPAPEKPYYMHGHILEVVNLLGEKTDNIEWRERKFPLIILLQDFTERYPIVAGNISDVTLRVIIATETAPDLTASERYQSTFKDTLYPLYQLFIKHLRSSPDLNQNRFEFTKTDRVYWGKTGIYGNDGLITNDHLDAIELELQLKIYQNC